MKTVKKILAIILTVLITVTSLPMATGLISSAAEDDIPVSVFDESFVPSVPEGYILTGKTNLDENGNRVFQIEQEEANGGIILEKWIGLDGNEVQNPDKPQAYAENEKGKPLAWGENLPEAYDSRDYGYITPVEYQIGGTCWAHAASACIEANYIKRGYGETVDTSEYHTVWFSKNGYIEGETDSANDGYTANISTAIDAGGNTAYVARAWSNFAGAALESDYPITSTNTADLAAEMKERFTYDTKYSHDIVLESIKGVDYNLDMVKQAVMDYGAVFILYYSDEAYYNTPYVDGEYTTCYYCPEDISTDHAVTVVGWDDNFSKDNFAPAKPENDGAWLIKNSWGENWGDDGYFWLSYEDKSIYQDCDVLTADNPSDYEEVYMYDGVGYSSAANGKAGANVFTADEDVYLTKISYGSTTNRDYTLKIYKGLPEECTDPTAGTLIYTQSGTTNYERYIGIEGDVKLSKGDKFSVVLEMSQIYYEGNIANITSNAGESFYMNSDGTWIDTNTDGKNNVCIRAIAKYQDADGKYKVTYKDPGYYSEYTFTKDGTVELPEKEGHTYVLTYNSATFTGTGITQDITVNMHCYPTQGTLNEDNNCIVEYNCIYCGEEMKEDLEIHEYEETVFTANEATIGYTKYVCRNCGDLYTEDYSIYEGAAGGETQGMWWQYMSGKLSVVGEGALPDYASTDTLPWEDYKNEIVKLTVDGNITRLGSYLFSGLSKMTEVSLPSTVEEIGERCFYLSTALTDFDCPENLKTIEECAFMNAGFSEFNFNSKIETLGTYAFMYCKNLTEVTVPGTVKSMSNYPFYSCESLKKIIVEEGVTYISNLAWGSTYLEELVLPSTVSGGFFTNFMYLEKYTVSPDNKTYCSVDGVLFNKSKTTLVSYPPKKTDVYYDIPDTVTAINNYAFSHTDGLKYLDMSCGVTTIKDKTFNQTKATLKYINLPEGLTQIWYQGFYQTKIDALYVPATVSKFQNPPFDNNGSASYNIPHFYTDSEDAAIKTFADVNSYECTVLHTAHDYSTTVLNTEPGCSSGGETIKVCACGRFSYEYKAPNEAHELTGGAVTEPTCTEQGYTAYLCSICNETVKSNFVPALGHAYEWITDAEPSCSENGIKHQKCSRCGDIAGENTSIPATGNHNYTAQIVSDDTLKSKASCTAAETYYYSCSVCSAVEGNDSHTFTKGSTLEHSYIWITDSEPTCIKEGTKHQECSVCRDRINEGTVIPTIAHDYKSAVTAPTCTDGGYTTYTCSACGDSYTADETEATGHSFGDWAQTKAPSCTAKGEERRDCSVCDHYETREVATIAHDYKSAVTVPTCTDGGYTVDTCSVCGKSVTKNQTPAKGHADNNGDGHCDECKEIVPQKNPSEDCGCLCHESGFMSFIWKFVQFFWKLFRMNPTCECGAAHY